MGHKYQVRMAALLDEKQHPVMMELLARMDGADGPDEPVDTEKTFMLIEEVISQYDLHIEVDREVWRSVDKHSGDRYLFVIDLVQAILTDDVLEALADAEDWRFAAEWAVRNNEWTARVIRMVD